MLTTLTCAYGEPWMGPHPLCDAAADDACRRFEEAVQQGIWTPQGYTRAEWKRAGNVSALDLCASEPPA